MHNMWYLWNLSALLLLYVFQVYIQITGMSSVLLIQATCKLFHGKGVCNCEHMQKYGIFTNNTK